MNVQTITISFPNSDIFSLEDFAAAISNEGALETECLSATPFPSSQDTKLKERSSIVRLWRKAREALEKPVTKQV